MSGQATSLPHREGQAWGRLVACPNELFTGLA